MKRKLFIKEFIGSKRKIFFFSLVVTIFFTVIGVVWIDMTSNRTSSNEADVIIYGAKDEKENTFELYDELSQIAQVLEGMNAEDSIQVVKSITRCIISIQSVNSWNEVMYTVKGYDEKFIRDNFVIAKGKAPVVGEKEVLLGNYIAQVLGVSVGDVIGNREYVISRYEHVGLPITLEKNLKNYEPQGYKVTGILNENMGELNYSIVLPYSEDDTSIIPNTLELYFKNEGAIEYYQSFIDQCRGNDMNIGEVSEKYVLKNNINNQVIFSVLISLLVSFVIIYLLVSYLSKGISKKLGLLKSFGIKNSTITKIFSGGLSILVGISYLINIVIVNVICYSRNLQLSKFLGFKVHKYVYDFSVYLIQLGLGALIVLIVWCFISLKIKTTSPNECMMK